jgi:protein SHQ1
MPITPRFEISQTLSDVTIEISVPSTRVSADSIEVLLEDGRVLHFFSHPYLLKLAFENNFQEDAHEECAKYDPSKATITLTLAKQEAVEWPRLDLTARLLQPKPVNSRWLKEVLQEDTDAAGLDDYEDDNDISAAENDTSDLLRPMTTGDGYGYANMFQNIFVDFCREGLAQEMLQLDNPEGTSQPDRQSQRRDKEEEDFDADRYLGDLDVEDDYLFSMAMAFEPHWKDSLSKTMQQLQVTSEASPANEPFFNSDEQLLLATLPYPLLPKIGDEKESSLYCGLLDLLFAYVYDHLMTQGDPTVESAWTISTLSYSLSWLDSLDKVDRVVLSSLRRMLIYPYMRNLDLGKYIWKQVSEIVSDQRSVIRCVLQIRNILDKSESYYLGNKLYIDPYLAWLQKVQTFPSEQLSKEILATTQLCNLNETLDLNLLEYEAMVLDEEGETEEEDDEEESGSEGDSDSDDDGSESDDESDSDESNEEAPEKADEETAAHFSTALLDSELGQNSMLKIVEKVSDKDPSKMPIVPESLSASVDQTSNEPRRPLIQEL